MSFSGAFARYGDIEKQAVNIFTYRESQELSWAILVIRKQTIAVLNCFLGRNLLDIFLILKLNKP